MYDRLILAKHHDFWDLWRKREAVVKVAMFQGQNELREALRKVRGFTGPDEDADRSAWALVLDIKTITPLAENPGPVTWHSEYASWLRRRYAKRAQLPASITCSWRMSGSKPTWLGRPPFTDAPDMTGLPIPNFTI